MKKTITLLIPLLLIAIHFQGQSSYTPVRHFVFHDVVVAEEPGVQPSQINRLNNLSYIFHQAYTSCFDTEYNLPIWVSHHLNHAALQNVYNTRPSSYPQDPQYPALKTTAFQKTGYDHGHLAPAADFKYSREAYNQSFFMSNMAPQHGCFNQKGWCHLEGTVRKWVEENPDDDFYIVSGAVTTEFIDTLCISDDLKVYVPKYFYKVIMILSPTQNPRAIGYIVPNNDVDNYNIPNLAVTVDSVESLTGLNFFSFVPHTLQEEAESSTANVLYYNFRVSCSNSNCESIYSNRVKPENRTVLKCSSTGLLNSLFDHKDYQLFSDPNPDLFADEIRQNGISSSDLYYKEELNDIFSEFVLLDEALSKYDYQSVYDHIEAGKFKSIRVNDQRPVSPDQTFRIEIWVHGKIASPLSDSIAKLNEVSKLKLDIEILSLMQVDPFSMYLDNKEQYSSILLTQITKLLTDYTATFGVTIADYLAYETSKGFSKPDQIIALRLDFLKYCYEKLL